MFVEADMYPHHYYHFPLISREPCLNIMLRPPVLSTIRHDLKLQPSSSDPIRFGYSHAVEPR